MERWAPWALLLFVIALWQVLCTALDVSEFIFPSPARIAAQIAEFHSELLRHAWHTFWVTMVGFAIAIVVGVLLGFLIGSSRLAYAAVYPLMTAFNALPKAAFIPILVVWFGIGVGPAVLTAFLISFFPIMVNIATGLATLEPELEDVLRVLGARRWDVLPKTTLHASGHATDYRSDPAPGVPGVPRSIAAEVGGHAYALDVNGRDRTGERDGHGCHFLQERCELRECGLAVAARVVLEREAPERQEELRREHQHGQRGGEAHGVVGDPEAHEHGDERGRVEEARRRRCEWPQGRARVGEQAAHHVAQRDDIGDALRLRGTRQRAPAVIRALQRMTALGIGTREHEPADERRSRMRRQIPVGIAVIHGCLRREIELVEWRLALRQLAERHRTTAARQRPWSMSI